MVQHNDVRLHGHHSGHVCAVHLGRRLSSGQHVGDRELHGLHRHLELDVPDGPECNDHDHADDDHHDYDDDTHDDHVNHDADHNDNKHEYDDNLRQLQRVLHVGRRMRSERDDSGMLWRRWLLLLWVCAAGHAHSLRV